MLIRVQSPAGTKRITCDADESTESFIKKVQHEFDIDDLLTISIFKDRSKKIAIPLLTRKTLNSFGIKHGDMVYMHSNESLGMDSSLTPSASTSSMTAEQVQDSPNQHIVTRLLIGDSLNGSSNTSSLSPPKEDDVDIELYRQSGLIERPLDPSLCRHGPNGKCVHCLPIEPYDENYLKQHNIKHMSFHCYLKKITNGIDKGKFALLENISCKIKPNCKEHNPWPKGICTKCQPNAITLNRQVYRWVDNIMFQNASIVDTFLNYWRSTGHQRIGYLYGYYSLHKDVPLGIKATVVAIYEPPQDSSRDTVKLHLHDPKAATVDYIAEHLGMKRVGWIFTDLIAEDMQKGTVKHLRNINTHFLSAQECIMAGYMQNAHSNPCHMSPDGYFGSKFVTICVTGDVSNQIHMEGYQVSNQCVALVRDNCLLPTKDAPELGFVRESSSEQYVPDVFYTEKDSYGNEVKSIARPLPIEYLLVDLPVSTPLDPQFTFNPLQNLNHFPIENRLINGSIQDFNALAKYLSQFGKEQFLEGMSDFHLLIYIATMDALPLRDAIDPLLEAIKCNNKHLAIEWAHSEQWATVEQMIEAQSSGFSATTTNLPSNHNSLDQAIRNNNVASTSTPGIPQANWSCSRCTFSNEGGKQTCEMCASPRGS